VRLQVNKNKEIRVFWRFCEDFTWEEIDSTSVKLDLTSPEIEWTSAKLDWTSVQLDSLSVKLDPAPGVLALTSTGFESALREGVTASALFRRPYVRIDLSSAECDSVSSGIDLTSPKSDTAPLIVVNQGTESRAVKTQLE
jgi:hypothetical protein